MYSGGSVREWKTYCGKADFGKISPYNRYMTHYSSQIMKNSDSKQLSLATASILGQPPGFLGDSNTSNRYNIQNYSGAKYKLEISMTTDI